MATVIYNAGKQRILEGDIALTSDTIKCALMGSGFTPNADTQHLWSDVSANEASGTGYTAGGATLSGKTSGGSPDDTNDRGVWDASDVQWDATGGSLTGYYAVLYDSGTGGLICAIDFGGAKTASGGLFTIQWNATGIFTLT